MGEFAAGLEPQTRRPNKTSQINDLKVTHHHQEPDTLLGQVRQRFLWETGRAPPDLCPHEQRLQEKLRPLIRKDSHDQ